MNTGARIQELRKIKKMTQSDLAAKIGTTPQNISQYERGIRNPKFETLQKIAASLEVEIIDLLPEEDRDGVRYVIDHLKRELTEWNPNEIEKYVLSGEIEGLPYAAFSKAVERADESVKNSTENFDDAFLKRELLSSFHALNRRGKIEAVLRLDELTLVYRFNESTDCDSSEETDDE